jgi:cytidyltransferase-like protein
MKKNNIKVAVSGYFDPIHVGHLEYLEMAKSLGNYLVVIINNNNQCKLKKGKFFMDENDRVRIVEALRCVDKVYLSIDEDRTVCKSLEALKPDVFANGGDRSTKEVPETSVCKKYNIKMIDGLGDKIRSSSSLTGIKEIK